MLQQAHIGHYTISKMELVLFLQQKKKGLLLFYVHWCLASMSVWMRVLDPLEEELQTIVSCHVGVGN